MNKIRINSNKYLITVWLKNKTSHKIQLKETSFKICCSHFLSSKFKCHIQLFLRFTHAFLSHFKNGNQDLAALRQTRILTISNVSSLDVSAQFNTTVPFFMICPETGDFIRRLSRYTIKTGESIHLRIVFDVTFKKNAHNEVVKSELTISYAEHQHSVSIS